ncbi:hypothetical protein [Chryseobacterium indoltheticum]|uniref:GLPGLI family protein n=2 Tax=Chryseobacterium indoltheticum TaxID=254 RepID=A0A381F4E3_9FLAO|nr:hypothetical protein [Chryseobacterium indoltheticum]AZA75958.1 hypothetical protein EG358_14505 [Chryseobacterium indoltheticum]SUX41348.1 Uncharacterised protein [Chryseobacterium indoltheticum]
MKLISLFLVFVFCSVSAQKVLPFDTLKLKETRDMFADDYGSIYLYRNKDFSFTKYDSLGRQLGKMMFTVPYKVQGVQNPLTVALFSENAQEIKFVDQNLNDIQRFDFKQKFSFIKHAYAEDLQQIWLLDESAKRLLQYNFRNETTINSYPFDASFDEVIDLLVFETKVYILSKNKFSVYNLKFEKLFEAPMENAKRFRRENEVILIIAKNTIFKYIPEKGLVKIFEDPEAQIVDKNSLSYFEIKGNKLYLYSLEDIADIKKLKEAENQKKELEKSIEKLEKERSEKSDILKIMDEIQDLGF